MDDKNKQLVVGYVKSQKERGVSDEAIRKALADAGWNEDEISVGFSELSDKSQADTTHEVVGSAASGAANLQPEPSQNLGKTSDSVTREPEQEQSRIPKGEGVDSQNIGTQGETSAPNQNSFQASTVAATQRAASGNQNYSEGLGNTTDNQPQSGAAGVMKYAVAAIITILVIGTVSAAAYFALNMRPGGPLSGPLVGMSQEEVIVGALISYMEVDSFKSGVEMEMSAGDITYFSASSNGYFEKSEDILESAFSLYFGANLKSKQGGLTFEMDTELEARLVDGVLYAKMIKAPELPFVQDLSFIEDKWIHVNFKEDLTDGDIEDLQSVADESKELIRMIEKHGVKVLEIAQEKELLTIESSFKGSDYTYELFIDLEKTPSFLRAVAELVNQDEYSLILNEAANEIEREWASFDSYVDMGDGYTVPFKIVVDGKTGNLKEFLVDLSLKVKPDENVEFFLGTKDELDINLFLRNEFSDINKTVDVEIPSDSMSIEEVFDELFKMSGGPSMSPDPVDTMIRLGLGRMIVQAEMYGGEDGLFGICNEESAGLKNLLESVDGISEDSGCEDSRDQWIAWSKLQNEEGYWCVDHTGFSGMVAQHPGGAVSCSQSVEADDVLYSLDQDSLFDDREGPDTLIDEFTGFIRGAMRAGAGWFGQ